MTTIENLTTIDNTLAYLMDRLGWPISEDSPAVSAYDANWEYYPEDLGLKDSDFAKITSLQQMKPLKENQDWAVFFVEFDYKRMQITVLRKILGALIFNKRGADHKIWSMENLLFVCFWGDKKNRTIGFVHFNQSVKGLPTLKALYFEPQSESREKLALYEGYLDHLRWEYSEKCDAWTNEWKKAFQTEYGQVIRDTNRLTGELAHSAQTIRTQILDVLEIENENGYVHKLLKKFKDKLVHDMDESSFADMYAQTICYGLFSARCLNADEELFDPIKAIDSIPDTNPFLRQLLREGLDNQKGNVKKSIPFDELELNSIIDLLQNTDIQSIVAEFNRQTRMGYEDPVIHFYEDFLTEYDKEAKINRGVFYTPLPVVNFIVRSVDQILKTEFGIADGLACDECVQVEESNGKGRTKTYRNVPKVQILDPATGTGTFLRQTILQIKKNFDEKHAALPEETRAAEWNKYVTLSLLHRIYGFELMMAPYAVAHMKLAMALKDTGYDFAAKTRLKVFLTNSLEEPGDVYGQASLFEDDAIAVEATQANAVKKNAKINVVIGNPPYSGESHNKGIEFIENLLSDYKKEPGGKKKLDERNPKWLNDDYCKFIRLGQYYIQRKERGVLAFINNHAFLDNPTFRGMRWNLLSSFDKIYIINLHGNVMKKEVNPYGEKDENIFDIQQGVSINVFVKNGEKKDSELGVVYYADLWGARNEKLNFLSKADFDKFSFQKLDYSSPMYFFVSRDTEGEELYNEGFSCNDLFLIKNVGVVTSNDVTLINHDEYQLLKNVSSFFKTNAKKQFVHKIMYRPFDVQNIYYDSTKIERAREQIVHNFLEKKNIGLIVSRQAATDEWSHVEVSEVMTDNRVHYSNKGISVLAPLYLYDDGYKTRRPNLNSKIVSEIEKIY